MPNARARFNDLRRYNGPSTVSECADFNRERFHHGLTMPNPVPRIRTRVLRRSSHGGWVVAALAIVSTVFMGMGGNSGPATEKVVPIPDKNYTVMVTDTRGAKAEARRFTCEGKVYFQGQYGQATVTLPFPKVKSLQVQPTAATTSPNLIMVKVGLVSGENMDIALERTSKCYGETAFGTYEIFMRDVTQLQFE